MPSITALFLSEERLKVNKDSIAQEGRDQLFSLLEETARNHTDQMETDEKKAEDEYQRPNENFHHTVQTQLDVPFLGGTHLNWPTDLPLQFLTFVVSCPHVQRPPGYEGMDLFRIRKSDFVDYLQSCKLFSPIKTWEELKAELKQCGFLLKDPADEPTKSKQDDHDDSLNLDDNYYYFSSLIQDRENKPTKKSEKSVRDRVRRAQITATATAEPPTTTSSNISTDPSLPEIDTKTLVSYTSCQSIGNNVIQLSSSAASWSATLYPLDNARICFPSKILPWIPSLARYEILLKDQSVSLPQAVSTLSSLFSQFKVSSSSTSFVGIDASSKYIVEFRSPSFDSFLYYQFNSLFSAPHPTFLSESHVAQTLQSLSEEDKTKIQSKLGTNQQMIVLLDCFSSPDIVLSHDQSSSTTQLSGDVSYEGLASLSIPILKVSGQRSSVFHHEHLTHVLQQLASVLSSAPFNSSQFFIYTPWNYLLPVFSSSSSPSSSLALLQNALDEIASKQNIVLLSSPLSVSPTEGIKRRQAYIPCCRSDVLSSSVLAYPAHLSPTPTSSQSSTPSPSLNSAISKQSFLAQVGASSFALSDYGPFVNFFYLLPIPASDPLSHLFNVEQYHNNYNLSSSVETSPSPSSTSSATPAQGTVDALVSMLRTITKISKEKAKLNSHSLIGEIVSAKRLLETKNRQTWIEYKVIEELTDEMLQEDIKLITDQELERRIEQTIRALEANKKLLAENEKALKALRTQETSVGRAGNRRTDDVFEDEDDDDDLGNGQDGNAHEVEDEDDDDDLIDDRMN